MNRLKYHTLSSQDLDPIIFHSQDQASRHHKDVTLKYLLPLTFIPSYAPFKAVSVRGTLSGLSGIQLFHLCRIISVHFFSSGNEQKSFKATNFSENSRLQRKINAGSMLIVAQAQRKHHKISLTHITVLNFHKRKSFAECDRHTCSSRKQTGAASP